MKIAFCGASGTGKSSVAQCLVQFSCSEQQRLKLLGVDGRALLVKMGLGSTKSILPIDYKVFQTIYIGQKMSIEADQTDFLTERSFVDCLAYWRLNCAQAATYEESHLIELVCSKQAKLYDRHFFFPVGHFESEDDGFRNLDPFYGNEYERVLKSILSDLGIEYLTIPAGTIIQRACFVKEQIVG